MNRLRILRATLSLPAALLLLAPASALSKPRILLPDLPCREVEGDYEEVHLGAALWNRGNVLLGIYGQWHSTANGDRRLVTMDLGLTVTHDAIHHVEPIPGFKIIPSREQPGSAAFDQPALMQGQGMENVGDKTFYWYSFSGRATRPRACGWRRGTAIASAC